MDYLVITENDESDWEDKTGDSYHYPFKYRNIITEGSKVIYYKGKVRNDVYKSLRLDDKPHYFGTATIGKIKTHSNGKSLVAQIIDYKRFEKAIPFKNSSGYLEKIPSTKAGNYWRDGVRKIHRDNFDKIVSLAQVSSESLKSSLESYSDYHSTEIIEGAKKLTYSVKYERSKVNRDNAIKIHGYNCKVCDFNFKKVYGEIGEGFIHVHHVKPLYELDEEVVINPQTDLVPVCPNCHAMIHRFKDKVFTIDELKKFISKLK